ncbi:MAG TPA: amidase family protein [Dehalococcoidia bacterium]|nr:amidase family protein [Dehalococcoidia bacterium]
MTTEQRDARTDLCYLGAAELAAAIRSRRLSPVEIVEALLERIGRVEPKLNAFTIVRADEARAEARVAEAAVLRGDALGPLHGVPFTLKDLTFTAGVKTMRGSRAFADFVPEQNAVVAERLLAAGGIFLGKTTTPELGNKGVTESPLSGTTNNPWKLTHVCGGSSGGAAAAVAAGLCPIADGSDGAGSIRIPASLCGVVGLKPSYGRVPVYPMSGGFSPLTHNGPIARGVADAALMLNTIAGPSATDAYSIDETGVDYVEALREPSVRGLRVAFSHDLGLGPLDSRVRGPFERALQRFAGTLGAQLEEAAPDLAGAEEVCLTIWRAQMGYAAKTMILTRVGRDEVDPSLLAFLDEGEQLGPFDYYEALVIRRGELYQRAMAFMQRYDLLLTPTLLTPAFPHPGSAPGPSAIDGAPINPFLGWLLTYPFNLTGQPAITVPCGFSDDGLPIGLQIVGRRHDDAGVLRAAAAFEQAAPWQDRRPALV